MRHSYRDLARPAQVTGLSLSNLCVLLKAGLSLAVKAGLSGGGREGGSQHVLGVGWACLGPDQTVTGRVVILGHRCSSEARGRQHSLISCVLIHVTGGSGRYWRWVTVHGGTSLPGYTRI